MRRSSLIAAIARKSHFLPNRPNPSANAPVTRMVLLIDQMFTDSTNLGLFRRGSFSTCAVSGRRRDLDVWEGYQSRGETTAAGRNQQ
jgi:hypothetical protein